MLYTWILVLAPFFSTVFVMGAREDTAVDIGTCGGLGGRTPAVVIHRALMYRRATS